MFEIVTLIGNIVKQILEVIELFAPSREVAFDEIETEVRAVMLEIGRQIVEAIVRFRGTGYSGKRIKTPSGEKARYREIRTRTIKTLMGTVEVRRAYYHIGSGYVPLDESLSLPQEQYSYAVQEQMSLYAIEESARKLCYTFPV